MAHISGLPNPLDDEKPTQIALYRGNSGPGDEYLLSNMYYDPEGVALRIDNVVFKISRSRLAQDSPVFREMFALPPPQSHAPRDTPTRPTIDNGFWQMSRSVLAQSSPNSRHVFRWPLEDATSGAAEGTLLNPIVMGDTDPAAFQDYLWILHERAPATEEFLASKPTEFKLRRLLHIVIFTHKYQNAELQSWARRNCLAVLFSHTVPLHPPLIALTIAATALFPPGEPTRRAFEQLIRGYLRYDAGDGSDESNARALLQRVDIIDLISECEAAGLFNLAAHARYTLLLLPRSAWESSERLTRAERLTLLCGSDALIQRWLSIRDLTMGLRDRSGRKRVDRLMLFAVEVDTGPSALLHKLRAIKPVVDDLCLAAGAPEQTSNVQGVIAEELKTLEDHMDLYFDVSKKGFSLQGQVV